MNYPHSTTLFLPNTEATQGLGRALGRSLPVGSILLLEGDLGSGKTTLVQGLGEGLGITEPLVSPTFTLIQEYLEGRLPLYHFDLYRLEPAEADALSIETYWEGFEVEPGIVAIEWPERLTYTPPAYLHIQIAPTEEGRQVQIRAAGGLSLEDFDLTPDAIAHSLGTPQP